MTRKKHEEEDEPREWYTAPVVHFSALLSKLCKPGVPFPLEPGDKPGRRWKKVERPKPVEDRRPKLEGRAPEQSRTLSELQSNKPSRAPIGGGKLEKS